MKTDVVLTMDEYLDQCCALAKPVSPPAGNARRVPTTSGDEIDPKSEEHGCRCVTSPYARDMQSSAALSTTRPSLAESYKRETILPLLSKNDASTIRPEFGTSMIAKFFIKSVLVTGVLSLIGMSVQAQVPLRSEVGPRSAAAGSASVIAPLVDEWIRQSPIPTARNLTGVSWATATHGFASGEALTLVETFDAGATWHDVDLGTRSDPLYNVGCVDANTCVAIGNSGTIRDIYRTTNAGATWQQLNNFVLGGSWYHIDFVSPTVGFMGSNGATVRTTDAGATWTLMSGYPSCPVMYGMDFRDSLVGLCGGDRVSGSDSGPGIFKTTDGGVNWVRKFSQSANDVLWLDTTTAIAIVGNASYRSTNAGDTWSFLSSQIFTGLDEMTLLPNGAIVGVSGAGDAWRSTDGGVSWTQTLVGPGDLPASWNVSFFDSQTGTIVGQGGYIFKSVDGALPGRL